MSESKTESESMPSEFDGLQALLERARRGDREVLPQLRQVLETHPEVWRRCGDVAAATEQAWIALAAGTDLLVAESIALQLADLRRKLAGPEATPIERLAIDRVAITWLQCLYAESAVAQAIDVPPKVAAYVMDRQDRAQRRHLDALHALATLRRLLSGTGAIPASSRIRPRRSSRPDAPTTHRPEQTAAAPTLTIVESETPENETVLPSHTRRAAGSSI